MRRVCCVLFVSGRKVFGSPVCDRLKRVCQSSRYLRRKTGEAGVKMPKECKWMLNDGDTENETGCHNSEVRLKKRKPTEIRKAHKDTENWAHQQFIAEWKKRKNDDFGRCSHYLCHRVLSICCFSLLLCNWVWALCNQGSATLVAVLLEGRCLCYCSTNEALYCLNPAVLWPCVSGWRRHLQQIIKHSTRKIATGSSVLFHCSSPSLTPAFLPAF